MSRARRLGSAVGYLLAGRLARQRRAQAQQRKRERERAWEEQQRALAWSTPLPARPQPPLAAAGDPARAQLEPHHEPKLARAPQRPVGTCSPPRTPGAQTNAEARIAAFMDRFCYVRSDYARQWKRIDENGQEAHGWARVGKTQPENCALSPQIVEAHLRGHSSIGTYLLDEGGYCQLLVLDHDDKRTLPEIEPATGHRRVIAEDGLLLLQDCRQRLAEQGIQSALAESRRGGHLFVFLEEAVPAREARALAMLALGPDEVERMARGEDAFEIYPKQDRRSGRDGAVGSNIALPLGVHLKDGVRHPFVDRYGEAVAPTLSGQLDYLAAIARCHVRAVLRDRDWLYDALDKATHPRRLREPEPAPTLLRQVYEQSPWAPPPQAHRRARRDGGHASSASGSAAGPGLIARWKEGVDCRDIVSAYGVELNGNGVGRCPFHDDRHASFQAWRDGWACYAEDRRGDALQFVMEQENMSPREALAFVRVHFPVPGLERREPGRPGGRA